MSLNRMKISRSVYSVLDFAASVGGLFGAVNALFGSIVFIF